MQPTLTRLERSIIFSLVLCQCLILGGCIPANISFPPGRHGPNLSLDAALSCGATSVKCHRLMTTVASFCGSQMNAVLSTTVVEFPSNSIVRHPCIASSPQSRFGYYSLTAEIPSPDHLFSSANRLQNGSGYVGEPVNISKLVTSRSVYFVLVT